MCVWQQQSCEKFNTQPATNTIQSITINSYRKKKTFILLIRLRFESAFFFLPAWISVAVFAYSFLSQWVAYGTSLSSYYVIVPQKNIPRKISCFAKAINSNRIFPYRRQSIFKVQSVENSRKH